MNDGRGRFEAVDRAALHRALLALHTCPRCRGDLLPVASLDAVWGCRRCGETWHLPEDEATSAGGDHDAGTSEH